MLRASQWAAADQTPRERQGLCHLTRPVPAGSQGSAGREPSWPAVLCCVTLGKCTALSGLGVPIQKDTNGLALQDPGTACLIECRLRAGWTPPLNPPLTPDPLQV